MNKWQKEVQQSLLDSEDAAIKELEKTYKTAIADINKKVAEFQSQIDLLDEALSQDGLDETLRTQMLSQKRSKIYQKQYQESLKGQVSGILDKMQSDQYSSLEKYLTESYENGYLGALYDIQHQGIPIVTPIDQSAVVRAVLTDSKISNGLYNRLGVDVAKLKKNITQEVSRGIATSLSYADIARNITNASKAPLARAKTIARTEGHRIQQTAQMDAQYVAKSKGADIVKQWDASLDDVTRESHRIVDGEIRELDEKFSNGLKFPGDPSGGAAEVCNCRCCLLQRARWALDDAELQTLKDRAEYFGLDKTDNFEEYKEKYLEAAEESIEDAEKGDIIKATRSISKEFSNLSDDLVERSSQIGKILDNYSSRKSKWSGNTIVKEADDLPGALGKKEWSCNIILRKDSSIKTAIHEHLHARSVSYYTPNVFSSWKNIEEATTELYAQEICKKSGIEFRKSYKEEVQQLDIAYSIMKTYNSKYDFAHDLFEIPMVERQQWLKEQAKSVIDQGKLSESSIEALNKAIKFFDKK